MNSALFPILFFSIKQEMTENSPLGDLLRGSVDVSSCQIGEWSLHFLFEYVLHLGTGQLRFLFIISALVVFKEYIICTC